MLKTNDVFVVCVVTGDVFAVKYKLAEVSSLCMLVDNLCTNLLMWSVLLMVDICTRLLTILPYVGWVIYVQPWRFFAVSLMAILPCFGWLSYVRPVCGVFDTNECGVLIPPCVGC